MGCPAGAGRLKAATSRAHSEQLQTEERHDVADDDNDQKGLGPDRLGVIGIIAEARSYPGAERLAAGGTWSFLSLIWITRIIALRRPWSHPFGAAQQASGSGF